jgi:hypothetical protein
MPATGFCRKKAQKAQKLEHVLSCANGSCGALKRGAGACPLLCNSRKFSKIPSSIRDKIQIQ